MSRKPLREEPLDKLRQFFKHLKLASSDRAVLVEKPAIKRMLEARDVKNIFVLKEPIFELAEEIASKFKECIVLLDVDNRGEKLYKEVKVELERAGLHIDQRFRNFLYHIEAKTVDGLISYAEKYLSTALQKRNIDL
ncbi:hypothetical protein DRZ77_01215 [Candidatus Woesearchaeota archaeon]|nr:hypothetical protein [Candidatus Woesearchaeota archaeon]RLE40780.1 MAG: hypothetical protein DRZ77_01215 [Candidatus Woesearchaeota archaeon]